MPVYTQYIQYVLLPVVNLLAIWLTCPPWSVLLPYWFDVLRMCRPLGSLMPSSYLKSVRLWSFLFRFRMLLSQLHYCGLLIIVICRFPIFLVHLCVFTQFYSSWAKMEVRTVSSLSRDFSLIWGRPDSYCLRPHADELIYLDVLDDYAEQVDTVDTACLLRPDNSAALFQHQPEICPYRQPVSTLWVRNNHGVPSSSRMLAVTICSHLSRSSAVIFILS